MNKIRAKLKVNTVTKTEYAEQVNLQASYSDNPEDNIFSKYTPVASFDITVTNPDIYGCFVPGASYYVDIAKVD